MKLFDSKQAAKRLGVSERRVRALCEVGRLGMQVAGRWVIMESELQKFRPQPSGRPRKKK